MLGRCALAATLIALVAGERDAAAGPWVPGPWHFYLQIRESYGVADARYDAEGRRAPVLAPAAGRLVPSGFHDAQSGLYVELGVTARLALVADFVALRVLSQAPPTGAGPSAVGVSDLTLGAKLLLFDDELTASLVADVTLPLGSTRGPEPLGRGDLRADFLLAVGKLFAAHPFFVAAELGARLGTSADVYDPVAGRVASTSYAPEILFGAQAGYTFLVERRGLERIVAMVRLEGRYGTSAPVENSRGSLTPPSGRFVKLGPTLVYAPARHVELFVAASAFVGGQAVPAFLEVSGGIAFAR